MILNLVLILLYYCSLLHAYRRVCTHSDQCTFFLSSNNDTNAIIARSLFSCCLSVYNTHNIKARELAQFLKTRHPSAVF
jgi:hypothetical protein